MNIYRQGFKSPARNEDLKSMSFVHILTFILVDGSFFIFLKLFFVSIIKILYFVHLFFSINDSFVYIESSGSVTRVNDSTRVTIFGDRTRLESS